MLKCPKRNLVHVCKYKQLLSTREEAPGTCWLTMVSVWLYWFFSINIHAHDAVICQFTICSWLRAKKPIIYLSPNNCLDSITKIYWKSKNRHNLTKAFVFLLIWLPMSKLHAEFAFIFTNIQCTRIWYSQKIKLIYWKNQQISLIFWQK